MRWAGKLGFSKQAEITPGKWDDVITEVDALGTMLQRTEALDSGDAVLPQYRTTTSISVLSDGRWEPDTELVYVTHRGKRWIPGSTVHEYPKLTFYLGEEYHGPLPDGP